MRAVDVGVCPSMSEGFGLALLEALACGKAVAASRAGALAKVGEGLRGVRLVPPAGPGAPAHRGGRQGAGTAGNA